MYFPHTCHTNVTGVICCCLLTFNNTLKNCVQYTSYISSKYYTPYFHCYYAEHVTSQPSSHVANIRPLISAASGKRIVQNTDLQGIDRIITDILNASTLECVPSLQTYPVFRKHTPCYNYDLDAMTKASSYNSREVRKKLHVYKLNALNYRHFNNFKYRLQKGYGMNYIALSVQIPKKAKNFFIT